SVQQVVSYAKEDRIFSIDLEKLRDFIRSGQLEKVTRNYSKDNGIDLSGNHPDFQL
ncbi:MAG: hypothetical protein RL447_205, partial [Bacteroidota bacterium]